MEGPHSAEAPFRWRTSTALAVMPEVVPCLCGSPEPPDRVVCAVDEGSGEAFTYLVCPTCSLERLSPRPAADEIGAYYREGYAPHTGTAPFGAADRLKLLIYWIFWAPKRDVPLGVAIARPLLWLVLWPIRYRSVLSFHPPQLNRVFEFGAAKSTDLLAFRRAGWNVTGCEPSARACALAAEQGIALQQATAETAVLEDRTYGCILFNNVFEHIHDPVRVLQKCHRALIPDGVLILIVPNHASFTGRLFGAAWPGYDAPRHTWGWSPTPITRLLVATGFMVDCIRHQSTGAWMWRATLGMRHAPATPGPVRRLLARRAAPAMVPFSMAAALLGHGDWIRVIARKR